MVWTDPNNQSSLNGHSVLLTGVFYSNLYYNFNLHIILVTLSPKMLALEETRDQIIDLKKSNIKKHSMRAYGGAGAHFDMILWQLYEYS